MTAIHADIHNADLVTGATREPARPEQGLGTPSHRAIFTGRASSGVALAFLLFDLVGKLLEVAPALEGTAELGYKASSVRLLGFLQLGCFLVSIFPRTAVLGAILWTGYLGGAVATHVRVENPLFSHVLFPVYVALLLWGGLWLRNPTLRALAPFQRAAR